MLFLLLLLFCSSLVVESFTLSTGLLGVRQSASAESSTYSRRRIPVNLAAAANDEESYDLKSISNQKLAEMSMDEIVRAVDREKTFNSLDSKRLSVKTKKEDLTKKKDKQYESYWKREEKKGKLSREEMEKIYYSLGEDESLAQKLATTTAPQAGASRGSDGGGGASGGVDNEDDGISLAKLGGLAMASAVLTYVISQNVHFGYSPVIEDGWWLRM